MEAPATVGAGLVADHAHRRVGHRRSENIEQESLRCGDQALARLTTYGPAPSAFPKGVSHPGARSWSPSLLGVNLSMNTVVSVVIPTFNYGRYVIECLDSLVSQRFTRFEAIIVDD